MLNRTDQREPLRFEAGHPNGGVPSLFPSPEPRGNRSRGLAGVQSGRVRCSAAWGSVSHWGPSPIVHPVGPLYIAAIVDFLKKGAKARSPLCTLHISSLLYNYVRHTRSARPVDDQLSGDTVRDFNGAPLHTFYAGNPAIRRCNLQSFTNKTYVIPEGLYRSHFGRRGDMRLSPRPHRF
jgi:hypothetical protein